MTPDVHLVALERETAAFARAWPEGAEKQVPGCPDWNGTKLAEHMTGVHGFWTAQVLAAVPGDMVEPNEQGRLRDVIGWAAACVGGCRSEPAVLELVR